MPHPGIAVEISGQHVAAARWGKIRGHLDEVAVQLLPAGAVMPSPVETNVTQPDGVRSALRRVFNSVPVSGAHVALLFLILACVSSFCHSTICRAAQARLCPCCAGG